MKVLFIGGTGTISSACTQLASQRGIDLTLLNRGSTSLRKIPENITQIHADIRNLQETRAEIQGKKFDVIVDWLSFTPEHVENSLHLFQENFEQYIFISSASAYQKPVGRLPITESTPLANPFWEYSRNKITCEDLLISKYRQEGLPITIVRPSHTYDKTQLPVFGQYTIIDRIRKGKKVIVHGDGSSLWVLTHHQDFAKGFLALLGNAQAIGEAFHITSDEVLSWNQIFEILGKAAGVQPQIIHVPSDIIALYHKDWGDSLLGDKAHSVMFDNSKIKQLVPGFHTSTPFSQGAREIIEWFDADPRRQKVDLAADQLMDTIIENMPKSHPLR